MNFTYYDEDHPDIEGARSRAEVLLGNDVLSDRRFPPPKVRLIRECSAVCEAETPTHYDPDTEVKTGGLNGVIVQLRTGEILLAVNPDSRRHGVATRLLSTIVNSTGRTGFFDLSVHNDEAQHFALTAGYRPLAVTTAGRIHYTSNGNVMEENTQ